jgi:MoaA/NifB/PqqE/SkfB family radical SAM enzyme
MKYYLAMLLKGSRYTFDFIKITNKRFCNSPDKVIGWYKGYPSFYLLSPPLLSKPAANSLTTKIMSVFQWRKLPDLASIAITDQCNCDCVYCSFTSMKKNAAPLNTNELIHVIRQSQELGVSTINFVGGEPLMHQNLFELIESVDKDLSQVILFTNGHSLKEKAKGLSKAGLTAVIVSIDSSEAKTHDSIKGLDGLFQQAVKGIQAAKKEKLLVGISTVVNRDDIKNGNLIKIFELGKELGINDIILFDAIPTGKYAQRQDLSWRQSELDQLINTSAEYNKKNSYPGIHPYAFSKSARGIGCAGGVGHFYITPYGDVCPCDFNPFSVGNVKNEPLPVLWERFSQLEDFRCSSLQGCRMQDRNFREKYKMS